AAMRFSFLETERLLIRRLDAADACAVAAYRAHPNVSRFQSAWTPAEGAELIQGLRESGPSERGKVVQFAIELKSEKQLIGDVGFFHGDGNGKSWIGYTVDPRYWHNGYAREAVLAVIAHYRRLDVSAIYASTDPENEASMKLLKAIGFTLVEKKPDD